MLFGLYGSIKKKLNKSKFLLEEEIILLLEDYFYRYEEEISCLNSITSHPLVMEELEDIEDKIKKISNSVNTNNFVDSMLKVLELDAKLQLIKFYLQPQYCSMSDDLIMKSVRTDAKYYYHERMGNNLSDKPENSFIGMLAN